MKILFFGDIVGRTGRQAVVAAVPRLRETMKLDAVIANADNAAGGFGVNPGIARELFAAGVDVITGGDHVWDQKETYGYIGTEPRLLRPHNFPAQVAGSGVYLLTTSMGQKLLVAHMLGQVFHKEHVNCPFAAMDELLKRYTLGGIVQAIFVDLHAEATSEKCAFGHYFDGRVSAVIGSHTHIPTADARLLKGKTAYQTDAGMCGDYDSVIGFKTDAPISAFLHKFRKIKMEPAEGEATLCATYVETDDKTGLAVHIQPLQLGRALS